MSDLPPPGHNLPKLAEVIPIPTVEALIEVETYPLKVRAAELISSCQRFDAAYPEITTDEQDGTAASVLAACQRFVQKKTGRVDAARETLKAPILAAGRLIDAAFPPISDSVTEASAVISRKSIAYKVAKATRIREAAQAEADKRAREAALAERLAAKGSNTVSMQDAADAAAEAETYQQIADSAPAELTRTHGSDFGTSSLKYKRVVTVVAPAEVPRIYCVPDISALQRAAGKALSLPIPTIAGCTISDQPDLTVRK